MPEGRPTKYNPLFNKEAEEYLRTCGREQTKLPKLTEFYRHIGITRETGDQWQNQHPEFSDTCKKIMDLQKEELIDDGLFGGKEVNASMAIFLLKANHGMIETEKRILAGDDKEPIQIQVVKDQEHE